MKEGDLTHMVNFFTKLTEFFMKFAGKLDGDGSGAFVSDTDRRGLNDLSRFHGW